MGYDDDMFRRYFAIFLTFARNSLVRDMSFRVNFILQCITSVSWTLMNWAFFKIIFLQAASIGKGTGWNEPEFFIFLGTVWIINALVQTFFMPNAEEFSELIRTGNLDFALLKPIDTQFLVSFPRLNWPSMSNFVAGVMIVVWYAVLLAGQSENPLRVTPWTVILYTLLILAGVVVMYSVMISLASTSVWLGRNQNLYMVWFYLTNFYRYPMEIYQRGAIGWGLWGFFMFVIPILLVANVPARVLAQPLRGTGEISQGWMILMLGAVAVVSLAVSRQIFRWALSSYRSASS
jgi:ABC-2 type transport system permease protein